MSQKPFYSLGKIDVNMVMALTVAAAALITPEHTVASLTLPVPEKPDAHRSIQNEFHIAKPALQDRIFFGAPEDTEAFYKNYPTRQIDRIVKSFLNSLADTYDGYAATPIISTISIDFCAPSPISPAFGMHMRQEFHHTATYFRHVTKAMPNPDLQDDIARDYALTILHALGPFLPADVKNSDQKTIAHNPLATHQNGILLKMVGKEYFANLHETTTFIGAVEGKNPATPEAAVLKSPHNVTDRSTIWGALARINELGELLTSYTATQLAIPYLLLMPAVAPGEQHIAYIYEDARNKTAPTDCTLRLGLQ